MNQYKTPIRFLMILIAVVFFAACENDGGSNNGGDGFDRKSMLTSLADGVIIPAYDSLNNVIKELKSSETTFTGNPSISGLLTLRESYKKAYRLWQKAGMFNFGPAEERFLLSFTNIYPASTSKIETAISSGTYQLNSLANARDIQGFPAFDYLLYGIGNDESEIVAKYTTDVNSTNRKKYLDDITERLSTLIDQVSDDWNNAYRALFIDNDGMSANSSTSILVNAYIQYFERDIRSAKVGIPAGKFSASTPQPLTTESLYNPGFGNELMLISIQSSKDFFEGKPFQGTEDLISLSQYLKFLKREDISDNAVSQFGLILSKANGLTNNVNYLVQNNPDINEVLELFDVMQANLPFLKVDMTSALGISISYVDNDGD